LTRSTRRTVPQRSHLLDRARHGDQFLLGHADHRTEHDAAVRRKQLRNSPPPTRTGSTAARGAPAGGNYPCLNGICNPAPKPGPAVNPEGRTSRRATSGDLATAGGFGNLVSDPTGPKTDGDPTRTPHWSTTGSVGWSRRRPEQRRTSVGNQVPPPGLGPLPSGMPPLNETRFLSNEV